MAQKKESDQGQSNINELVNRTMDTLRRVDHRLESMRHDLSRIAQSGGNQGQPGQQSHQGSQDQQGQQSFYGHGQQGQGRLGSRTQMGSGQAYGSYGPQSSFGVSSGLGPFGQYPSQSPQTQQNPYQTYQGQQGTTGYGQSQGQGGQGSLGGGGQGSFGQEGQSSLGQPSFGQQPFGQTPVSSFSQSQMGQTGQRQVGQGRRGISAEELTQMQPIPRTPTMVMADEGDQYTIELELPGATKENLQVHAEDELIEVTAVAKPRVEKGQVLVSELVPIEFQRIIPLPERVKAKDVKAKLSDGVLTLEAKKQNPREGRQQVNIG